MGVVRLEKYCLQRIFELLPLSLHSCDPEEPYEPNNCEPFLEFSTFSMKNETQSFNVPIFTFVIFLVGIYRKIFLDYR